MKITPAKIDAAAEQMDWAIKLFPDCRTYVSVSVAAIGAKPP